MEYVTVGNYSSIEGQEGMQVSVHGRRICIFNLGGKLYAIQDECSHEGTSFINAIVEGDEVVCPKHGQRFKISSGEACGTSQCPRLNRFPVRVQNGKIEVLI